MRDHLLEVFGATRKQRVSMQNQRVSSRLIAQQGHTAHLVTSHDDAPEFHAPEPPPGFQDLTIEEDAERFLAMCHGISTDEQDLAIGSIQSDSPHEWFARPMPATEWPPVFPSGPLNLNPDGTTINFKKSHGGPHAKYWERADGEEIERLLTTGTIRPTRFRDIPANRVVTYVNPVCVEKLHDDGSIKFRTRLTIGGDRIVYPYDKAAVTAEMDAFKILLNCMISEDAYWSTIDLTDFYLGTDLPYPEFIRIPTKHIPQNVVDFYQLQSFIQNQTMYCSVHKTHYGLPQAGILSQQRLFQHLKEHGYFQLPMIPSVFRNESGSIRFTLVVDDFAVV